MESRQHIAAKLRIKRILESLGYHVKLEAQVWRVVDGYLYRWQFDVFATLDACPRCRMWKDCLAVEIDGKKGHGTRITIPQNRFRDRYFLEKEFIRTVRFELSKFAGRKKIKDDAPFIEEMMAIASYS